MSGQKANKRVVLIGARAGMTPQEFHAHWSGPHAEIAKDLPGLSHYVQNHVMRCLWQGGGAEDRFLGIPEVMFADPDRLHDTIETWPRRDELKEDEARFLGVRIGNWVAHPESAPAIAHRRIVVLLTGVDEAGVQGAVEAIAPVAPCHAEQVMDGEPGGVDWIVFVELSPEGAGAEAAQALLAPEGPVLRHVTGLGGEGLAYLTYSQVNRLPFDVM
ncbi:MAG: EthD domain-containing protein [Pseudomonadota bacterium]|nr:EthD domain-containing protein [Pseudomonadota bacterium]